MTAQEALASVEETAAAEAVSPQWDLAMAALPSGGLPFLQSDQVRTSREWCGFPQTVEPVLLAAAEQIQTNPALARLAWHCAWRVFEGPEAASIANWPRFEAALGPNRGLFYLLVGLSLVPHLRRHHRQLGIPESVTRETCQQVRCFCGNYEQQHRGRLGIPRRQVGWLRHYTRELYVRLGRLEYWLRPFGGGVVVYRQRQTGEVLALAESGARFDPNGYLPRPADTAKFEGGWTATLLETAATISGTPISPWGVGLRQPVTLPAAEWQRVLAKGDAILQVHIPAGGGMLPDACNESMRLAVDFFTQQFADRPAVAIQTASWIYNPDLEEILPGDANLVRHLRETYLYPIPSGGSDGLWFVFLHEPIDPKTSPRDTSLQRAILDWIEEGNDWRCSGMFVLTSDAVHLGTQHYRRRWPPAGLGLPVR